MATDHDERTPFHDLTYVKHSIRRGEYDIREDVSDKAFEAFGWDDEDVKRAILGLKSEDFQASRQSLHIPGAMVDSYTGLGRQEENYYIHFYIHPDTGRVIINSCKRNNKRRRNTP